jgi:hypothetical protein
MRGRGFSVSLFSVPLAFLFTSVASGEPVRKKSVSLEDARKAGVDALN